MVPCGSLTECKVTTWWKGAVRLCPTYPEKISNFLKFIHFLWRKENEPKETSPLPNHPPRDGLNKKST